MPAFARGEAARAGLRLARGDRLLAQRELPREGRLQCEGVGFARKPTEFMKIGDTVEVEIEGIGVLRNTVQGRTT